MKHWLLCTVFLLGSTVFAQSPMVKPVSLEVTPPLDTEDQKLFFMGGNGTAIRVIVSAPGKRILAVDEDGCKLQSFTDDKGTDLTKPPKRESNYRRSWVEGYVFRPNDQGDRGGVRLVADGTPVPGAKSISIKGTLRFLCGADEKTVERKDVAVKIDPKTKIKIGDFNLTISDGFQPTFLFESNQPNLRSVEFLDAEGKKVDVETPSKGKMGFNKKYTYSTAYNVKTTAKSLSIKITYFNKIEPLEIPVDLTVGVGF